MRSPLTRLAGETVAGIGHNQGPPLEPGRSWRRHVWKKARAALVPHLPLEIVRLRVARARQLGLSYPTYASVRLGTGRDIVAFLFTSAALDLPPGAARVPARQADHLARLIDCERLLMADVTEADRLREALVRAHGPLFAAIGPGPDPQAGLGPGRAAIRAILDPMKLPGDAVVMIGALAAERDWADAARLAKFLPAESYFAEGAT
ncbi:MAG: hypothetical protein AAGG06_10065 [Pseudomonadota bacterium]